MNTILEIVIDCEKASINSIHETFLFAIHSTFSLSLKHLPKYSRT